MPINASLIIAIIALFIAIAVWMKARRIGPVIGVALAAFVVMAIADPSFITAGGNLFKKFLLWAGNNFTSI